MQTAATRHKMGLSISAQHVKTGPYADKGYRTFNFSSLHSCEVEDEIEN